MHLKASSEKCCDVIWPNPGNAARSGNLCSQAELPYFWKRHCVNFETAMLWRIVRCELLLSHNAIAFEVGNV